MSRDYVILFLPIAWALVATAVGIILYKSSEAFFENLSTGNRKKRTLRLTGSVVIAALTFYGIKTSTPEQNLVASNPGIVGVSISDIRLARSKIEEHMNDLIAFEACLELDQTGNCRDQLTGLQNRSRELQHIVAALTDAKE